MTQNPRRQFYIKNSYASIYKTFSSYSNPYNITYNEYSYIVKTFFFLLCKELIYKGKLFVLPGQLGTISLRKLKTIGRGILDYQLYRNTGTKRYIVNNHSDQWAVHLVWDQSVVRFKDPLCGMFKLNGARAFKREIAKYIKNNNIIHKYYDK